MVNRALRFAVVAGLIATSCGGDVSVEPEPLADGPVALVDTYELAYGVYDCTGYRTPFEDFSSTTGIDSPGDGVLVANPQLERYSGSQATIGVFMENAGGGLATGEIRLPDGQARAAGDDCRGRPGEVLVLVWDDLGRPPRTITRTDPQDVVLSPDGGVVVVAFAQPGTSIPLPPWAGGPDLPPAPSTTSTTAPPPSVTTEATTTTTTTTAPTTTTTLAPAFEIRPVRSSTAAPCPGSGYVDGDTCFQTGAAAVTIDGVASASVVFREDVGEFGVALVFTDAGIDGFNALADQCASGASACPTGEIVIAVDGEVAARATVDRSGFAKDDVTIVNGFGEAEARAIADRINAR